ncbi:MAG: hypothetical protein JZU47_02920 [Prolixibacteraceae bacterium]|nr:hypothetical protein [Prolixibacteraceae bacterium]
MKRIFFSVFVIVFCFQAEINAKPKYISTKTDKILQLLATDCNRKIEASTKPLYFFTTMHEFGHLTIAKGEGSYYFMLQYIALPHKEDLTGSIHLLLSNGEQLNLSICGKKIDRQSGENSTVVTNFDENSPIGVNAVQPFRTIKTGSNSLTYCLYEINQEDLRKLTEIEMNFIVIDYSDSSTQTNDSKNRQIQSLKYETQSGKRKFHKVAVQSILGI